MGKQTKRARKFEAKGGVKSRLEKGTITNKGKLKRKRRTAAAAGPNAPNDVVMKKAKALADEQLATERRKKEESDFMSPENVGDLDLESFFEKTVDELGGGGAGGGDTSPNGNNNSKNSNKADDDDDASESEEEEDDDDEANNNDDDDDEENSDASDSGMEDDDDDIDAAAQRMQREMDKLGQSDPEFHKFLQENEQSLLQFDAGEDDDDDADVDKMEDDAKKVEENYVQVTPLVLKKVVQGAFKSHGVRGLKKLIQIYKCACHLSDAEHNSDKATGKQYRIDSRKVFDEVMVMTLTLSHEEFAYHLLGKGAEEPKQGKKKKNNKKTEEEKHDMDEEEEEDRDDNTPLQPKKLMKSYRWKEMKTILTTFFKATFHVLSEGKDPQHLTFILKALGKYIPFLTPLPKLSQHLLKSLVNLWSAPLDSSEDYQVVRLNAFMRIRQLAITQPFPFIEDCLKKTYLAYAKRAKYGTSSTVMSVLPTLTFMGNCVVELYSLDFHSSYQHAFVYIRQLALHLRAALQKKTPETFQIVYCWQYMHCLKLWTAVLVQSCKMAKEFASGRSTEAELLQSLIYPLTEIIQGVVRLVPTTRHLPLRLHCVRFLQQLASASERFVPTTSILLEALELKEFSLKPKRDKSKTATKGISLPLIIKLPKEGTLRTAEQMEACIGEIFVLLNREADLYRYSPGFPEFQVLICQRLRKFIKTCSNGRWRAYAKGCIDLCERYALFSRTERGKLMEAPKDVVRMEALKPPQEPSMCERYEAAISKEKRLEEASRPAAKVNNKQTEKEKEAAATQKEQTSKQALSKKEKPTKKEKALSAKEVYEQQDEVAEGVDWSDDDNDDDDSEGDSDDDAEE